MKISKFTSWHQSKFLSTTTIAKEKAYDYCQKLVKNHDFDNYMSGLLVPHIYRKSFFAIHAFNVEIASIKDQAQRNVLTGRLRFQWWREILSEIYAGDGRKIYNQHPVAELLAMCVNEHDLTLRWFERSLEARLKDLYVDQFDTMNDIENYAEHGHSSINYLLLEAMDVKNTNIEYAASHIGVSYGIVILLRAFQYYLSQNLVCLPKALCTQHGLSINDLLKKKYNSKNEKALKDLFYDLASQAHAHLETGKELYLNNKIHAPNSAYCFNAPATRCSIYLEDLRQYDFDPLNQRFIDSQQNSALRFQLKLLKNSLLKNL